MDSSTTSSPESSPSSKSRGLKRKLQPEKWERNKRRRQRLSGKGYVNTRGTEISRKKFEHRTSCCKLSCCSNFTFEQQKDLFSTFYSLENKEKQDSYLMTCVHKKKINRLHTNVISKHRVCSWKYTLKKEGQETYICKSFLMNLFQVSEGRMKTILQFCKIGINS